MSAKGKSYKDLEVWTYSINLTVKVYAICRLLPREEAYGLKSQMARSAVSVASNIAEGAGRSSKADFARFIVIARGSLAELNTQLIITSKVYSLEIDDLQKDIEVVGKMISGLLSYLRADQIK